MGCVVPPGASYVRCMAWSVPSWDISDLLEAVESASPVDAVDAVTAKLAAELGSDRVAFLIADLAGREVVRLGHVNPVGMAPRRIGDESAQGVSMAEGAIAEVLARQRPQTNVTPNGWRVLAPVTQRGEAVGVLEVLFSFRNKPDDDTVRRIRQAAHLLAFAVIANRRHTDLFEWGQRTAPM